MFRKIVLVMAILAVATAASAQVPDASLVRLPVGDLSSVQSVDISGTLSSNGITCTWTNGSNASTINFTGNFVAGFGDPKFDIKWMNTADITPMAISTTATTDAGYSFSAPYMPTGGSWKTIHDQSGISADWAWGTNFPISDEMHVIFEMKDAGVDYDLTIVIEWGAGVPVDVNTWGDIKALYR